jgi:hypothetical protein
MIYHPSSVLFNVYLHRIKKLKKGFEKEKKKKESE